MTEVPFKLVHVVGAFATVPHRVLRKDGVDREPAEPLLQHERVLGPHGVGIFRVALDRKVHDRVLVLVLEQAEQRQSEQRVPLLEDASRDILEVHNHTRAGLREAGGALISKVRDW